MTRVAFVCSLLSIAIGVILCATVPTISFIVAFGLAMFVGAPSGIIASLLSSLGVPVDLMDVVVIAAVSYGLWTLTAIVAAGRTWTIGRPECSLRSALQN